MPPRPGPARVSLDRAPARSGAAPRGTWSGAAPARARDSLELIEPGVKAFDPRVVAVLQCCFDRLCGGEHNLGARSLRPRLDLDNEYLAQRILDVLDADHDGVVGRDEFVHSVRALLAGGPAQRLLFAFRIHDLDDDSTLDRSELMRMIEIGLREDSLVDAVEQEARRLCDLVLAGVDANRDGRVSFAEFEAAVRKHAVVLEQLTGGGLIWLAPDEHVRERLTRLADGAPEPSLRDRLRARGDELVRKLDNRALTVVLVLSWGLLNAALFERAMVSYAASGAPLSIQIARGAGACLKLGAALVLLPMLRLSLTWMRRTPVLRALPLDDATAAHRFLGMAVVAFGLLHTGAHLVHAAEQGGQAGPLSLLVAVPIGASGTALLAIVLLMWLCALPRVRGRFFELFYLSHLLYLAFFGLLLVHGRAYWRWAVVPVALFVVDRAWRVVRRTHTTTLADAAALPSGVTRLELHRPAGFEHQPTDYVFVRIKEIAPHEWHPFTISSAPERDRLTLHVRKLGNWTSEMHSLILSGRAPMPPPLEVELDGPYGAPCSQLFSARHVVLIGAGIGATPFASVLESIALGRKGDEPDALQSVYFFWIDRNPRGFEWFRGLLAKIERERPDRHLDMRVFMTGGRSDPASAVLTLARELAREQRRADPLTGLSARTRMGHPDYADELGAIAARHAPEPVSVFFCGPDGLARKIRAVCLQLGLEFKQERF